MVTTDPLPEFTSQLSRSSWSGSSWSAGIAASLVIHGAAVAALVLGAWASGWWLPGQWETVALPRCVNSISARPASPLTVSARPVPLELLEDIEPVELSPPSEPPIEPSHQPPPQARTIEASLGTLPPAVRVAPTSDAWRLSAHDSAAREARREHKHAPPPTAHDERLALPRRQVEQVAIATTQTKVEPRAETSSQASMASAAAQGGEAPPAEVFSPAPAYPPDLLAAKIGGVVKLRVQVDDDGRVVKASVHRSSGYAAFDREALLVMRRWRFAKQDQRRVTAREFIKPLQFRIVP